MVFSSDFESIVGARNIREVAGEVRVEKGESSCVDPKSDHCMVLGCFRLDYQ